jgi:hypothetical protein
MKQLENSKESHQVFVGNIDYNISGANAAPITVKGKWCLKCKKYLRLGYDDQDPFFGPLDLRALLHATSTYGDM